MWYNVGICKGGRHMKILHTSDWHFGISADQTYFEEDHRYFLDQLFALIRREQVGAVLCAGDVYDSSIVTASAIDLYNHAVTTICKELGIPMVIIAGNHDSAPRLAACRDLLAAAGLHISGVLARDVQPVLLDGGHIAVYPLPFFDRERVISLFPEHKEAIRTQEAAAQLVCDHIRAQMDPSRCNIVMSHSLVVDAELSESDRSALIGHATAVSREVFDGFDYVALGHIHKPQIVAPHIRYSGSPLRYSFGTEEKQIKGVVILDTDTGEQTFHPLPCLHGRRTVRGTLAEIEAMEGLENDYLRLEITDRYAGLELMARLRERFPYLLEFQGKNIDDADSTATLTVADLQSLDETGIMLKFMAEHCHYQPTDAQITLFRDALSALEAPADCT